MLRQVLRIARMTVGNPKAGAAFVLGFGFSRRELLLMAALVAILAVLLTTIEGVLIPRPATGLFGPGLTSPFVAAVLHLAVMAIMAAAIYQVGRLFGGTGTVENTTLVVIWLQLVNLLVQGVGFFFMLALAVPFALVLMVSAVISTWLLVNFVAVLHDFDSMPKVFGGIIGLYLVVSLAIAVLLSVFGLAGGGA